MADGYVPRFFRPGGFVVSPPSPRPQAPRAPQQGQHLQAPDPSVLFGTQAQQEAECRFPSAFPADGSPNIIQRFWIRLLGPPVRALILAYHTLIHGYHSLRRDGVFATLHKMVVTVTKAISTTEESYERAMLIYAFHDNRWSLLVGLVVIVALSSAAWFLSPKGENQTIWRSTLILSFASCYIMWAITFLAQWHPLIEPKMAKLRPGMSGGS